MLKETHPPGASQCGQISWKGQASWQEVWDVQALLDPACWISDGDMGTGGMRQRRDRGVFRGDTAPYLGR